MSEPQVGKSTTHIESTINVTTAEQASKIIGTEIETLQVDFFSSAPGRGPIKPECFRAYLESVKKLDSPTAGARPSVQRLYQTLFRAHLAGAEEGPDLFDSMIQLMQHDVNLGSIQRVMLLADAGMGKSPALKYVRSRAAQRAMDCLNAQAVSSGANTACTIPLLIRLGDLRGGHTLETLVRDSFNASLPVQKDIAPIDSEQADDLIRNKTYQCLFLFDDLDVLLSMHNESGLDTLIYFMEAHRQHQYLIACRTSSYRGQVGPVDALYLDNLSEQDTRSVLGDDYDYERLSSALKDLACNRSMLKIILELDDVAFTTETKGQLVRRWVKKQLEGKENIELTELAESLCERLAFSMQSEHARTYTEQQLMSAALAHLQEWHERYTWREVLNRSRDCEQLYREEESHQWHFTDRQAEAYFAAAAVLHDPAKLAFVLANASDYRWRELLEILIGLMPEPSELLFELIERDVNVAAEIFRFAGSAVDHRVVDALIDALIESMGHQSSTVRKRIVERIGESGHPRVPEALVQALHREWSSMVLMAIVKALWQWTRKHPDAIKQVNDVERRGMYSLPWEAKSIGDILTLYVAAAAPAHSPESEQPLIDLLNDRSQVRLARGLAAFGLALVGTQTALQALIALVRDIVADDFVAWCSVDALTQFSDGAVKATAMALWTEDQYQVEGAERHRARAIYLLGWTGVKLGADTSGTPSSGSATPAQVLNAALSDTHPLIRGFALGAVTRLDMHDARQRIEQILAAETEPWVLRRAAEALGQIGTLDSIAVLKRYERHERVQTRSKVRQAIAEIRQRYGLE